MRNEQTQSSFVERIVNKGPFPNAQKNMISRVFNISLFSFTLPIVGFVYVRLFRVPLIDFDVLPRQLSLEAVIIWICFFFFFYTCLIYHASQRVREYLSRIKDCLDYDEDTFRLFQKHVITRIFNPSYIVLVMLLVTIPFGFWGVVTSPIYLGDNVTTALIGLILLQSTFLNWIASWMLLMFLTTSSRFGRNVPLRVNPFDPDRVGGLSPLSDLSTLAIFDVGVLALIIVPIWYVFFSVASFVFLFVTSILIPAYFFCSMSGVYEKLRKEKEDSLREMNDEFLKVATEIRGFLGVNHKRQRFDEEKIVSLGQTLNSLNIIYDRVKSMHAFPINSEIIVKVALSAVLPILGVIADFLLAMYL